METNEYLTLREMEELADAYLDCRLSEIQEKEFEYLLLDSPLSSPRLDEARCVVRHALLVASSNKKSRFKSRPFWLRCAGIAVCMAIMATCVAIFSKSGEPTESVTVYVDGKKLSGREALFVADKVEASSMAMLIEIQRDVDRVESQSLGELNSTTQNL